MRDPLQTATGTGDRDETIDHETVSVPVLVVGAGARLMDTEFVQFHPTGMAGARYGEEWDGRLVTEAPMEVAPTAHYTMGGVDIDFSTGETGVPGLYAVGETVAGVHGANRMGGNSLAEAVAIGKLVGEHVAEQVDEEAPTVSDNQRALAQREFQALTELAASDGDAPPRELLAELGEILWEYAGILRDEESIRKGLAELDAIRARTAELQIDGDRTSRAFEFAVDLSFSLPIAEATLRSALERSESRGAHHRTDTAGCNKLK